MIGCSRPARSWAPILAWSTRCGLRRPASPPTETPTYRRSEAFGIVRAECQAVRADVGLYETTNYGKYEVTGRGARAWLDHIFASRHPSAGAAGARADAQPGRPDHGRSVDRLPGSGSLHDCRLWICRGISHALVAGARAARRRVRCARRPRPWWEFRSPGRVARELLQPLVRADLSASAFKLFEVQETAVGLAPTILTRAGFTGELGYELWTTPDYFLTLYDELRDAGRGLGLVLFGGRALSSLRGSRRLTDRLTKISAPTIPRPRPGSIASSTFGKADFIGRAAALAERATGSDAALRGHGSGRRRCRCRRLRVHPEGGRAVAM